MLNRGPKIIFAAVAFLAGGLFALRFPVFIEAYDQFGWQIKCGSGFMTDLTQASSAAGMAGNNYVSQCNSALVLRRAARRRAASRRSHRAHPRRMVRSRAEMPIQ